MTKNVLTKRRKRRRVNAVTTGKHKSVRQHRRRTGRTGSILPKKTPSSKMASRYSLTPNPPVPDWIK